MATTEPAGPADGPDPRRAARRRQLALLVTPVVVFSIAGMIGNAFAPTLLVNEPVLLVVLNSRLRYLVLVSERIGVWLFFGIPLLRSLVLVTCYFLLGRRYGERAVQWLEASDIGTSGPILRIVRWVERQFHRARYPVLFLLPGYPLVLLLAGASDISAVGFAVVVGASVVLRLVLVRFLAGAFTDVILDITDWIADNQLWLTGLSFALVIGFAIWGQRSGRHRIETVDEIVEELEDADDAATGVDAATGADAEKRAP
jgi:hypothetical protein